MTSHRREILTTAANPDARHDYLVEMTAELGDGTRLRLRYVPDRDVLEPTAARAYIDALPAMGLEALALAVLDDLSNELVPRWVEVRAERADPLGHVVTIEDRQPAWNNPELLARFRA